MPVLEIITIGTELLLGEIQDTNSTYIARTLRDYGIDIYRITTIGDNSKRIASTIREALNRADIVITTGGLGPTIDDPTRQAVADAVGQDLIFLEELWKQIKTRFKSYGRKPTENNRRQAYIPKDAIPIHNPVGTAPCFIVEGETSCIVSLPGVPREMEWVLHQSILPFLRKKYNLKTQIIKATVLHAATMGESTIDEKIGDLEEYTNPTVGLLAHPGQVDIRVTAKAPSEVEAFALSEPVVQELRRRLGENVYGQDEETLESVICDLLNQHHLKLCLIESGTNLGLIKRVKLAQPDEMTFHVLDPSTNVIQALKEQMRRTIQNSQCDIALGVALIINKEITVHFIYQDMQSGDQKTRNYGGPRDYAPLWAQNTGLDFLRRHLITTIDNQKLGEL
jgi:nicotinamide-nucleotide amidase